jgi:DNA-binding Xre family transcriptional regulator
MLQIDKKKIKVRMVELDINQKELSQRAGLSEATISRILHRKIPFTSTTVSRLAVCLEMTPLALLYDDED